MPYVPAANTCKAELVYNWDGQIVENVLFYTPQATLTLALMNELGAYLVNWFNVTMKGQLPTTISLINVRLTDLTTQTAPVANYATGLPIAGTSASPSLPNNCALVITKRTAFRGRSYRGRIYHPGLMEADVTNSQVSSGKVTTLLAAYNLIRLFTNLGTDWVMSNVSLVSGGFARVVAEVKPVVSFDSDGRVDSQRRRLPGRGS